MNSEKTLNTKHLFGRNLLVSLALFTIILPSLVEARTVVRTGQAISIAEDQSIEGDFYGAGTVVNLSGLVTEDSVIAAGEFTLNGTVTDDALFVGGVADIHGSVGGDLRVVAGTVTIAEPVTGNVLVIGGTVEVLSTASIGGDLIMLAGEGVVSGAVGGDIVGHVGTLRIDAPVAGNVNISVDSLTFGDRASVAGSVSYESLTLVTRSQEAVITGDIVRNDPKIEREHVTVESFLLPVLAFLFGAALWFLFSRKSLQLVTEHVQTKLTRSFIIGFIALITGPFVASIFLVSVIGSLVGLVVLFWYFTSIFITLTALCAVVGTQIFRVLKNPSATSITLQTLVIGALGVGVLLALPVLGSAVFFGFFVITFGALTDMVIRHLRS
jgi:hypothetical protein